MASFLQKKKWRSSSTTNSATATPSWPTTTAKKTRRTTKTSSPGIRACVAFSYLCHLCSSVAHKETPSVPTPQAKPHQSLPPVFPAPTSRAGCAGQLRASRAYNHIRTMRKRLILGSGVLLLAILVTLVVWQGSFNLSPFAPSSLQQTYLFWAVSTLIFVLTVTLGFILFRTAVRLYIERRSSRPGSHIKSKLIGGAIALSVLPVFFLVLWSVSVLNRNLESWFSRPARNMNIDLAQVAKALDQEQREKLSAQAQWLGSLASTDIAATEQFCLANRIERADITDAQGSQRILCAAPNTGEGKLYTAEATTPSGVIKLSARMPLDVAAKQRDIDGYVAEYNRLAQDRKAVRSMYLLLLTLITLFILFFAIWMARYMAGQISTPITALLKAAEQIRKGN